MSDPEEKLRAFCEGLEMENIDILMGCSAEYLRKLGEAMAKRTKKLLIDSTTLEAKMFPPKQIFLKIEVGEDGG